MKDKKITETKFWSILTLTGNAIGLNLLFILCCLPVITIGPALSGLYSAVRYMIRKDGWFRGFREGFTNHFLRTCITGTLCAVFEVYVLLQFHTVLLHCLENLDGLGVVFTYGIMALIPPMTVSLWPLNVYIPYDTMEWISNSVSMVAKAPGAALVTAGMLLLPLPLLVYFPAEAFFGLIAMIGGWFVVTCLISTLLYKDQLFDMLLDYKLEKPDKFDEDFTDSEESE